MSDLFGIGISGLLTSQKALATAGHNVSNATTEGYSRQRVEVTARTAQRTGAGYLGTGVQVSDVRRLYDGFLTTQIRASTATHAEIDTFHGLAAQIDNLLGDDAGSLSPALQSFFDSMQALAADPASVPARQVALGEAEALVQRFNTLDSRLIDERRNVEQRLTDTVADISSLASNIAQMNHDIVIAQGTAGGKHPNDLLDERDELIRQLAERIDVNVITQSDGALNVTVGSGQALVTGSVASTLSLSADPYDASRKEVAISVSGSSSIISQVITGGELAGVLNYRNDILDASQNALGRIAIAVARSFNHQHQLGVDLNGVAGGDFFTSPDQTSPTVLGHTSNTGNATIDVAVSDADALTTSDYRLDNVGGTYTLTRLSDGTATNLPATFPSSPVTVDGLTVTVSAGTINNGDSFVIQPTRIGARQIGLAITSPSSVAAALPVAARTELANTGSAVMTTPSVNAPDNRVSITFTSATAFDVVDETTGATLATGQTYDPTPPADSVSFNGWTVSLDGAPVTGDVFSIDHTVTSTTSTTGTISTATVNPPAANLTNTVRITFTSATAFDVVDTTAGPTLATGVSYTPGDPISFNGWTVSISGTPDSGDQFYVEANANGVGDNGNALALAGLQTTNTMNDGAATYSEAYGQLVALVGTTTHQADINAGAQLALLDQVVDQRESFSGVNLDEEAADLLRFQQAYQANAQVIAAADTIFETLLTAVGR